MKLRVPRIPLFSLLSLALLIAVAVLWARSHRQSQIIAFYTRAGHLQGLASDRTGMLFFFSDIPSGRDYGLTADAMTASADDFSQVHDLLFDPKVDKHHLGFHLGSGQLSATSAVSWNYNALIVPYWALLIVLAILPITMFRGTLIYWKRKCRGQCLSCGYDIRASVERCPECGTPIPAPKTRAARAAAGGASSASKLRLLLLILFVAAMGGGAGFLFRAPRISAPNFDPPIADVSLHNVSLHDAVTQVWRSSSAKAPVQWGTLVNASALDDALDARLHGVGAAAATRAMLASCGLDPAHLDTSEGRVRISDPAIAHQVVRVYSISQIVAQDAAQREHLRAIGIEDAQPQTSTVNQQKGPAPLSEAGDAIAQIIMSMVRPDDWHDNGGDIGQIWPWSDCLVVRQFPQGHREVAAMLDALQSCGQHDREVVSLTTQPITPRTDIDAPIADLRLDSVPLRRAMEILRDSSGVNLVVGWSSLQRAGVDPQTLIDLRLQHTSVRQALRVILDIANASDRVIYGVSDGVIVVTADQSGSTSTDSVNEVLEQVRIYDVRDVIDDVIAYMKAHGQLRPTTQPAIANQLFKGMGAPNTAEEVTDRLVMLIEDQVDADTWKDNGGSTGSVREFAGRLIIKQKPQAHRQIIGLLRLLRGSISKEGTTLPSS